MEIKSCPWCGEIPSSFYMNQGDKWGGVECSCLVHGPEVRTGYDRSDNADWHNDAIAEWNKRKIDEEIELLKSEINCHKAILATYDPNTNLTPFEVKLDSIVDVVKQAERRGYELAIKYSKI